MLKLLKRQKRHGAALLGLFAGAGAGVAFGYALSQWTWGGLGHWLALRSTDAVGWAAVGALLVPACIYGAPILTRLAKRGSRRPARKASKPTTRPPRAEDQQPANLNARLARVS
jgi:hypothetical protein